MELRSMTTIVDKMSRVNEVLDMIKNLKEPDTNSLEDYINVYEEVKREARSLEDIKNINITRMSYDDTMKVHKMYNTSNRILPLYTLLTNSINDTQYL